MKKFIAFMAISTLGCGKSGDKGELVGLWDKKWNPENHTE
jgi:hypothetical protein